MRKVLIGVLLTIFCISMHAEPMTKKKIAWLESQEGVKEIGCNEYEDSTYFTDKDKTFKIEKSSFNEPRIFDDSILKCDLSDSSGVLTLQIIEYAVVDSVKVRIFHSDGSGSVGDRTYDKNDKSWGTGCKKDTMTDDVTCYIKQSDMSLFRDKEGYLIRVGSNHYPSSIANLRINKDSPYSSGDDGIFSRESSEQIINKLTPAELVSTRYVEWPYKRNVDNTVAMDNYNVAKKILDTIYENHN